MITIIYGNHFLKSVRKIPKEQQGKLAELLEVIQENPFYSKLHTKSLSG